MKDAISTIEAVFPKMDNVLGSIRFVIHYGDDTVDFFLPLSDAKSFYRTIGDVLEIHAEKSEALLKSLKRPNQGG